MRCLFASRTLRVCLFVAAFLFPVSAAVGASIDNATMDAARLWFQANPASTAMSGAYLRERKEQLQLIDQATAVVSQETWNEYKATWYDPAKAAQKQALESTHPALHYFRSAELAVLDEIRTTKVERGAAVWGMYNLGVVVKTPTTTFGVDLNQSDPQAFAEILDFLVVSHVHPDHFYNQIAWKLKQRGPEYKVYAPLNVGGANVKVGAGKSYATDEEFGDTYEYVHKEVRLRFVMSFQTVGYSTAYGTKRNREPNLISRITCGAGDDAKGFTILHTGDSVQGAHAKMARDSAPVDVLFCHGGLGKTGLRWLVKDVEARLTVLAHANELGHGMGKWHYVHHPQTPGKSVYEDKIESPDGEVSRYFPASNTTTLTWGERPRL